MSNPLQNAAQGMLGSSMGTGLFGSAGMANSAQGTVFTQNGNTITQQAYNQAVTSGSAIYRDDWLAPRVHIEVDRVTNGYVLAVGSERMIAKDIEELQQHFVAQVVSKLVLDESK